MAHHLQVIGLLRSPYYHKAKDLAEELCKAHPEAYDAPELIGMFEFQWKEFVEQLKRDHPDELHRSEGDAFIFQDNQIMTTDQKPMQEEMSHYQTEGRKALQERIASDKYDYVFMDVCIGQDLVGKLVFELYKKVCPRTCANFVALCVGEQSSSDDGMRLSYINTRFHRIVRNGWVQGGDICDGSGAKGMSVYGPAFEDECFAVAHDRRGILGMVNHGRNTNNSQFYITLTETPWMDQQYVAFGRLVEGRSVLQKLEHVATKNERPLDMCQVSNCGVLTPENVS